MIPTWALGTAAMVMGTVMRSSLLIALVISAAGVLLFFGIIAGLF